MKKFLSTALALFMALATALSLSACGKKGKDGFCGTWMISFVEYEGSKFTVEEWKSTEDEDLSEFRIVFKDGGKAYIYDGEYGDLVNWMESGDSIMIGDEKGTVDDGMIRFDYYGNTICLKKVSDSQTIPAEGSDEAEEDAISSEEDSAESEVEDTAADNAEWREFLADYEAWVDDYIEIVLKYKENPTDMTILSDYTEMLSELSDWSERSTEIALELEDTTAALEYSAELSRIAGKATEAAKEIYGG